MCKVHHCVTYTCIKQQKLISSPQLGRGYRPNMKLLSAALEVMKLIFAVLYVSLQRRAVHVVTNRQCLPNVVA